MSDPKKKYLCKCGEPMRGPRTYLTGEMMECTDPECDRAVWRGSMPPKKEKK